MEAHHNCIIIRYAELGLKGNNRADFERRLIQNIKEQLYKNRNKYERVERKYSRIIIITDEAINLKQVFGITNYSYAKQVGMNYEDVEKEVLKHIPNDLKNKTFRVTVQRQDKRFPLDSNVLAAKLGEVILEKTGMKVKLKEYDYEFFVEIFNGDAYVFTKKINSFGGLPVGSEGVAFVEIKNKTDELAALLTMKRGVQLIPHKGELTPLVSAYNSFHHQKTEKPTALVVGDTINDVKEHDASLLILRPLVGYDDKRISKELKAYEEAI